MQSVHTRGVIPFLYGLWLLLRIIPVISWSICGLILGIGLAIGKLGSGGIPWGEVLLMLVGVTILHGVAAHAYNDREDWRSGTDQRSPGILSGGSKVIQRGLIDLGGLSLVGLGGTVLVGGIALYFAMVKGPVIWGLLILGIWAGVSYSLPPIRLAYRPFWGEWIAAFPALVACTVGSFYLLTGEITAIAALTGVIHTAFCIGWLMQHHLPDIAADLQATPVKMTTAALISQRFGLQSTPWLVAGYFALVFPLSLAGALWLDLRFILSSFFALPCIFLALKTDPEDAAHISRREQGMIGVTVIHALVLTLCLAWG